MSRYSLHKAAEKIEVYLEYTKAKVVRGNMVTIGKGCEIELVEYHDRFEKSDKSSVIKNKRIG